MPYFRPDPSTAKDVEEKYCDGEGPECPRCGRTYVADEAMYYDESGFEEACDNCNLLFFVQPFNTTTWTTRAVVR